jgi:hypothetical protein
MKVPSSACKSQVIGKLLSPAYFAGRVFDERPSPLAYRWAGILSVRQASWRVPAGVSPAQVGYSSRLVVSVAWWKVTTTAKRTQRLRGVGY